MSLYRKTAVVQIELPSGATAERLPLTTERAYGVMLTVDGQSYPAGYFYSPINDEQWRDFSSRLSDCNVRRSTDATAYRNATFIRGIGLSLYKGLAALNTQLQTFLDETGTARRLVIQTTRPELHLLPWGALYAGGGTLLASGDLSVVQAYDSFSPSLAVTQSRLNLLRVTGDDTNLATALALKLLPPEIVPLGSDDTRDPDILHVEAHGDRVNNRIGDVSANDFGTRYAKAIIALLWSCYSSSANSWGDSPALCLHQAGAIMVLSFLAELNVLDAASIAEGLYGDAFGPAASRNPESALVRIRAEKFTTEFAFANWASMTIYLRCPIDLSALPLNGPRVPAAGWLADISAARDAAPEPEVNSGFAAEATAIADAPGEATITDDGSSDAEDLDTAQNTDALGAINSITATAPKAVFTQTAPAAASAVPVNPWAAIAEEVRKLQPGSWRTMAAPVPIADASTKLPMSAFGAWRGNVIRLDGSTAPLSTSILLELDLIRSTPQTGHAAQGLVWFLEKIAHYGSPLIVWTNALPRHIEFLKTIAPSPALTFLLLTGPEPVPTIPSLVDENRLEEARTASAALMLDSATPVDDETLSAAYYASVRGMQPDLAKPFLMKLQGFQEWLLLTGNLFSRDRQNVLSGDDLIALGGRFVTGDSPMVSPTEFALLHRPEDFYRLAMNQPPELSGLREAARAKHELAYLMQCQGRPGTAEVFYRLALADLDSCDNQSPGTRHDSRWHFALAAVLRDLADLLSSRCDRLAEASDLLKRAMAIQAYHGMLLQLGYSETTAAKIALTGGHHSLAIHEAVNAANRMELCANWSGWGEALGILFDSLAETRETTRMINLANLANEKIRASNLSKDNIAKQERLFKFEKAKAHWIAGDIVEARDEFEEIRIDIADEEKTDMDREIDRVLSFLRVERKTAELHLETASAKKAR